MAMEERLRLVAGVCRAVAVVLAIGLLAACAAGDAGPAPRPANLLLITLDTMRADHLGCYGYPRPTSPAIDRFAASSTVFADVTCSMPTTLPSHVTIFTGQPPEVHGATRNGQLVESYPTSCFDLMSAAGARTAAIVSAGVVGRRYVEPLGFDEVIFDRPSPDTFQVGAEVVSDNAVRWLADHGDQPFALWLHYYDPHEPYTPPASEAARFTRGYRGPLPDALETEWLVGLNEPAAAAALSDEDRRHVVDLYDAEVAFMDGQIGRVLTALDAAGLAASTVVVIVADHGQAHGEGSFWGHGERLLEPVIKVPLLVRVPGEPGGRVVPAAVETLDLMPSLIELLHLEPVAGLPGRSLAAALRGERLAPAERRIVTRRSYPDAPQRAGLVIHRVTSKLTCYREPDGEFCHLGRAGGAGGLDGEDFFGADPEASRRLAAEAARLLSGGGSETADVPPEDVEMLRALGYTE